MKWMVAAFVAFSIVPIWAQESGSPSNMDRSEHAGNSTPEIPVPPTTAGDPNMPGMDHTTMPEMSESSSGMDQPMQNNIITPQEKEMSGMDHGAMKMQGGSPPTDARDPHAYSGGYALDSGEYTLSGVQRPHLEGEHNFSAVVVNRLERIKGNTLVYDTQAWFGRTYDRLVLKAEGNIDDGDLEEATTELLWAHSVAVFWDTQLGMRYDNGTGPDQGWLTLGIQGLAPYWFEVDATAYVSDGGKTAISLQAEYELLLTQKLILQPGVEVTLYGKRDEARQIGSGLSEVQAGLRLRYEFTRQFAPYVGVEWSGKFGDTANFARTVDEKSQVTRWVAGVRFWF